MRPQDGGILPLVLLASMVVIAVALEVSVYGRPLLPTKLPLAALLLLALRRPRPT